MYLFLCYSMPYTCQVNAEFWKFVSVLSDVKLGKVPLLSPKLTSLYIPPGMAISNRVRCWRHICSLFTFLDSELSGAEI